MIIGRRGLHDIPMRKRHHDARVTYHCARPLNWRENNLPRVKYIDAWHSHSNHVQEHGLVRQIHL